jgi:hypothetical protein
LGIVYFSNMTAKARTTGARLVRRIVGRSSDSGTSIVGRAREDSMEAGVGWSASENEVCLDRLDVGLELVGVSLSEEVRFLEARFAALRTCFASFSSGKIFCNDGRSVFEMADRLEKVELD